MARRAQPNAGHVALAKLARLKPRLATVTQNVDDLHERAGSPDVIHLHGGLFDSRCFACARPGSEIELPPDAANLPTQRATPPHCMHCGGYIRPGVVWFGETLPEDGWKQSVERAKHCDLLLAIGTSGVVQPAAGLPRMAEGKRRARRGDQSCRNRTLQRRRSNLAGASRPGLVRVTFATRRLIEMAREPAPSKSTHTDNRGFR